jgi:hypothetical protein
MPEAENYICCATCKYADMWRCDEYAKIISQCTKRIKLFFDGDIFTCTEYEPKET